MRLEIHKVAGEEVPFIVLNCPSCSEFIVVPEREVKMTRPLYCASCKNSWFLSYREFITITEKIAAQLLEFMCTKLGRQKTPETRYKTLR